ncbi:hypothetical protein [Mangrovactinospora gilvigrisea]|nr:hypothetical protein [Mangrovactinospora gilvigrisea]
MISGIDWTAVRDSGFDDGAKAGQITSGSGGTITSAPQFLAFDHAVAGHGGITVAPATMKTSYIRFEQH